MFRTVPQIDVQSIETSVAFYRDVMGFEVVVADPPESPAFVTIEREDASLFLVQRPSTCDGRNGVGQGVRIYFEVDDARALWDELSEGAAEVVHPLRQNEAEDYWEFVVRDPDGLEIGIYS